MRFLQIWIKHALINLGCLVGDLRRREMYRAAECVYHAIVPPQFDHAVEDCEALGDDAWSTVFAMVWLDATN